MSDSKKTHNSFKALFLDAVLFIAAVAADQYTKVLIRNKLPERSFIDLIPEKLQLYHHENTGASWGVMQGWTIFFIVVALIVSTALCILLYRLPQDKKYIPMNIIGTLILSGAIGNTIDRIMKGSVTDFIYVKWINFPIFNVADIYIVVATITLLFMILFYYKDEDLQFMDFLFKKNTASDKQDTEGD
ncbi:MAG: signal peptidase II [Lachnospiraceae bacterium]|nr:signal peptidase II [Lachnospiraceae bacterium]